MFTLKESLTPEMIKANKEERKSSQKRYHELKDIMHKNPDYVPSIDDNYIIQMNEGGYFDLIKKRDVLFSCFIYGGYAIIQAAQDALYPVWLILSPENNGFSFTSSELGWMYTGLSPNQIFSTPILFPMLSRLLTPKKVAYLTGVVFSVLLMIAPVAGLFTSTSVPVRFIRFIRFMRFIGWIIMRIISRFSGLQSYCHMDSHSVSASCSSRMEWYSWPTQPIRISVQRSMDWDKSVLPLVVSLYVKGIRVIWKSTERMISLYWNPRSFVGTHDGYNHFLLVYLQAKTFPSQLWMCFLCMCSSFTRFLNL